MGNITCILKSFFIHEKVFVNDFDSNYNLDYKCVFGFKIIWTKADSLNLKINEKLVNIGNSDFLIIMPEYQVEFNNNSKSNFNIISFSVDYLQIEAKSFSIDLFKLFIKKSVDQLLKVKDSDAIQIDALLKMIIDLDSEILLDKQIGVHLINSILLLIIRNNHNFVSTPDKNFSRIHDFFLLIFKHSKEEKRVTFYADQLFISTKRLNQILLDFTGHSASYFIHEHIIMQAKHLLLTSKMNITEIARELGFEDVAYFSRFFKRIMYLSPEQFRNLKV